MTSMFVIAVASRDSSPTLEGRAVITLNIDVTVGKRLGSPAI
jgi:hypothetical protein